jgi:dihydrolipoamide dehydrogenase
MLTIHRFVTHRRDLAFEVNKDLFPCIASGRDEGVTKLLFDDSPEAHGYGKILGGSMVGTHAGVMIGVATEIAHGSCTDVLPQKK